MLIGSKIGKLIKINRRTELESACQVAIISLFKLINMFNFSRYNEEIINIINQAKVSFILYFINFSYFK